MAINKWVMIGATLVLIALVVWAVSSGGVTGNVITASVVSGGAVGDVVVESPGELSETPTSSVVDEPNNQIVIEEIVNGS